MKAIKKQLKPISLLMAFLVLFINCDQYDDSLASSKVKYSGEEIFKGLFLYQNNEISSEISFLNDYGGKINNFGENSEIKQSLKEISEISEIYINEKYPHFFQELETVIYSEDLFEIQDKLDKSVVIIEQSLLNHDKYREGMKLGKVVSKDAKLMAKIQKLDLSTDEGVSELHASLKGFSKTNLERSPRAAVFFAAVVAVAYIVAVAVSFVVAAYSVVTKAAYWDPTENYDDREDFLVQEMAIAEISDYFNDNGR
jgi:hypothetical protein